LEEFGVTSTTTTALILTACIALSPRTSVAQSSQNSSTTTTAQQAGRSAASKYLAEAERLLNSIPQDSPNLKKDAKKKFSALRERFAGLVKAYQVNGDPFVPPAVDQEADLKSEKESAPANWKMYFSDVESDLAAILGGGSALPPSTRAGAGTIVAAAAPPIGTSGTTTPPGTAVNTQVAGSSETTPTSSVGTVAVVGEIGIKNLDPEVRRQLEQFRLELELFFAATTMNLESEAAR
jgi:hypothetical protein